jgi:hypothetical protein
LPVVMQVFPVAELVAVIDASVVNVARTRSRESMFLPERSTGMALRLRPFV